MTSFPTLSIIIVTWNVERTLPRLLKDIENQEYPKVKIEIIIIDGGSTDNTLKLIKQAGLKIKVKKGKYPRDPEACKGEGLSMAKGEIVALIDADNALPNTNWLKEHIAPLVENKNIVGSYAWRFAYLKNDYILNRYFSLIGSADPVGLYLGKFDKISYISDKWEGFGRIIKDKKKYFIVQFDKNHFPTLGSNGFFARRKILLKGSSSITTFFHIDTPFDLLDLGYNKYAVIRDVVIHDPAEELLKFIKKRTRYMQLHYQKRKADRRYLVFDPKSKRDSIRLFMFVIFSITFIQPIYVSLKGYVRIRDIAWFLHPIVCFGIMSAYVYATAAKLFKNL